MEPIDWELWGLGYIMAAFVAGISLIGNEDFNEYESLSLIVLWPLSLITIILMFFPKAIQKMSRQLLPRSRHE